MSPIKSDLRRELLSRRGSIFNKAKKDESVFEKLVLLAEFAEADAVLTYVSTEREVGTSRLIEYCFAKAVPVFVPGIVDERMGFFRLISHNELCIKSVDFANVENCVCIVPGLAFSLDGRRIGYGGGYYDRFLHGFVGVKIGLCYREFVLENVPTEPHDEKVDFVITD